MDHVVVNNELTKMVLISVVAGLGNRKSNN